MCTASGRRETAPPASAASPVSSHRYPGTLMAIAIWIIIILVIAALLKYLLTDSGRK